MTRHSTAPRKKLSGKASKMPLPPVVTKFLDDIDKKLHEQNQLTTVLEWVEEKTGLKRLHIVLGFAALHILCLTFSNSAELICNIIGFVYPAFMSLRAIESHNKDDDTQWLTYWVIFALLCVIEFFSESFLEYLPIYWLLKCIFLLYLYLPMTMGAQKMYASVVQPLMRFIDTKTGKSKGDLNEKIAGVKADVTRAARDFVDHVKPN